MATEAKRATIYFDPSIHQALKFKSIETSRSISTLVNEAVKAALCGGHQNAFENLIRHPKGRLSIFMDEKFHRARHLKSTMKKKTDSPYGRMIYSKRLGTVEHVFCQHQIINNITKN